MTAANVDVAVLTYKPGRKFIELLTRLEEQTVKPGKIIVINTDESLFPKEAEEKAASLPDLSLFHISPSEFDHAFTRNLAASYSDADYLIFLTQDALPADKKLIEELLRPMENEKVAVSYARQLPSNNSGPIERYNRNFNYPGADMLKTKEDSEKLEIKTIFCSDVCSLYRKKVFDLLGGFKGPAVFNEDMVFADRAVKSGYGIYYASSARVVHSHEYTALQQFKRNFDLGASQKMNPEVFNAYKSEGEGKKLVKGCISSLIKNGKPFLIPGFLFHCAARYAGFLLGKNYRLLNKKLILSVTSNKGFWTGYLDKGDSKCAE